MDSTNWFHIIDADQIDSPALCVYRDRVAENIHRLIQAVPPRRLRPHVKSHKMKEVCGLMMAAGVSKFKCATIAEAEMLGMAGAKDVLIAYPVLGPKAGRLIQLIKKYPATHFSCLVDSVAGARDLAGQLSAAPLTVEVYMDLNVGMNRTGVLPSDAPALYEVIRSLTGIRLAGLHAYDGHIHDSDPELRQARCLEAFADIPQLKKELELRTGHSLTLVAGGSPTYMIHARQGDRECSPGTFIFWDKGYADLFPEEPFEYAALLLCRIISMPSDRTICVDLGHKSVAPEMPQPRVFFLNAPDAVPLAQNEEHLVLTVPDIRKHSIGQVLYGVPWHICPSVALYDKAKLIQNNRLAGEWPVIARQRQITV